MERTKKTTGQLEQRIQVLSELTSRMSLSARLGSSYEGERDLYSSLGYKKNSLEFKDFFTQYIRQDIAKAIIDRPIQTTWRGPVEILESTDDEVTPLETAWKIIFDSLQLKNRFIRLDKLVGIGRYGILLMGMSDITAVDSWMTPLLPGKKVKLLYVKPFGEASAVIDTFETDVKSSRYGLPLVYQVTVQGAGLNTSVSLRAHWTRVIHIVEGSLESDIEGTPRLEAVYNRLQDLEKLVGSSAEMFWRNARPGYQGKIDPDFQMTPAAELLMKDQITEYENDLRRIMINQGVELNALTSSVSDPGAHVDVQLQMISAVTGIPKRILTGSERGELSSTQDSTEWLSFIAARREEYVEPMILRPFVDFCIKFEILPPPNSLEEGYNFKWSDLFSQSEKERAEVGKIRATALKEYASQPTAESIVPPEAFMEFFLGLSPDQIELINEIRDQSIQDEVQQEITPEESAIMDAEKLAAEEEVTPEVPLTRTKKKVTV